MGWFKLSSYKFNRIGYLNDGHSVKGVKKQGYGDGSKAKIALHSVFL